MSAAISPSPPSRSSSSPPALSSGGGSGNGVAIAPGGPMFRAPSEAFGQTGIRQYVGSFLALVCAAAMAVSLAMWARSQKTADVLDVYHPYGRTMISSTWGRLRIASVPGQAEQEWTWYYNSRPYAARGVDPWQPSIWRTLGIEMRFQQVDGSSGSGAWWIRLRWSTAAVLTGIWPLMHSIRQTRQLQAARLRRETGDVARYCGRCGRAVGPADDKCHHCGRRL
jgi:hypothetical protein